MQNEKPWYLSKTIWGSLVAVASSLAATLGLSFDAAMQASIVDAAIQLVGACGALLAIYGRLSATHTIT